MKRLDVHLLPELVSAEDLTGTVVVIDVLRATTTITTALAAGAKEVIPCLEVDEAKRIARRFSAGQALLGGERGGLKIPGFDLGNSPSEYTPAMVAGRTLVFTTTNGTRAMMLASRASRVLLAAFVNASAVARLVANEHQVRVLCAGTRGKITREDSLMAGHLAELLAPFDRSSSDPAAWQLNDEARLVRDAWRFIVRRGGDTLTDVPRQEFNDYLAAELRNTQEGRNLLAIDSAADIAAASQMDQFDLVPRFDPQDGLIRVA